jgi:phospholipid/cholesterol/gamma-HCH transport system substrate-binding protein
MSRRLVWGDLKVGLLAFGVIVALSLSILLFARVGALHGDTTTLFVAVGDATGVLPGTDVWVSGKKVGIVEDVHIRPVASAASHRLAIHTRILNEYVPLIRRNSVVDIRPGGNLIGSPVVYLKVGTPAAPAIRNGDTLFERPHGRFKPLIDQVTAVANELDQLSDSTTRMLALLSDPRNSIGAFQKSGIPRIQSASAAMSRINAQRKFGSGTLGLASRNNVGLRISRLFAQKDSITLLLKEGRGSVGRFRRDSTLFREIAHLKSEADSLRLLLSNPGSPVSRMKSDSALAREMNRAKAQLDTLMADLKKHPMKYIRL